VRKAGAGSGQRAAGNSVAVGVASKSALRGER
jgi:hypothetical protein